MVRPSEVLDPLLPVLLLVHETVNMVVDLADAVLTEARVLDRGHLLDDLFDDRLPPLPTFGNRIRPMRVPRPPLLRLRMQLPLHLHPAIEHGLCLFLIACHRDFLWF